MLRPPGSIDLLHKLYPDDPHKQAYSSVLNEMRATSSTSFTLNKTLQTTRSHLSSDYGALPGPLALFLQDSKNI